MRDQAKSAQHQSEDGIEEQQVLLCPSAQPDWDQAVLLGIVGGTANEPRVSYLDETQPVTDELLALTGDVLPTEVLRIAAPCIGGACQHFNGSNCTLVARTVIHLDAITEKLPPCAIRPSCRWWHEEGKAACQRCPQIVTDNFIPTEQLLTASLPPEHKA
jgi:hypothetical protein